METVRFDELDLYPQVLRAIADMGFEEATPIQSQAIPVVMSGVDVIGQAQTGTGKTASFGIPVLHKVDPNSRKTQVIILSPTRELAIQVADEIRKLAKYMHGVKVLPVYGGQEIGRQIKALKGGAQIIVGTPGRVMDHLRRKTIRCDAIHTVVLDEAGRDAEHGASAMTSRRFLSIFRRRDVRRSFSPRRCRSRFSILPGNISTMRSTSRW